ncbi:N-acetyl-gamma-glutamyl-phosphate reductase [Hydrogenoanaerobacterium sp.]|uniref:N-acetyl-gamma-glutamyl-phosphate reductase n=1 Tax=Hydrogenoanaerobacterium sp. TaxID=2953763 RepID=UPI002897493F|nr:N-acetyl-gamma-glutamyl-phosphate reductase [Hydrogenoanaerobacterium sp.]
MSIKVGIIGATGYAGVELVRLLLGHPQAELAAVGSVSFEGKPISEVYPSLAGIFEAVLTSDEQVLEKSEVIFASLPHGLSEKYAASCAAQGKVFIDLGADFRLWAEEDYKQWYGLEYDDLALHQSAVYALPELYREQIKGKKILGNPGCYPTSIGLGLYPALKNELIDTNSIIIDSKSGVTGAGRGLSQTTHYPDCNEAFSPYKVAEHRHTPEIEQTLSDIAGEPVTVTFVPHLLPVNRGIVSTIYGALKKEVTLDEVHAVYTSTYAKEQFVRVCPIGGAANLKNVRMSNYCDVSLHLDERTRRLIVVSAIDNMGKGAAGQAIQNMNIVCGLPENTGLNSVPPCF